MFSAVLHILNFLKTSVYNEGMNSQYLAVQRQGTYKVTASVLFRRCVKATPATRELSLAIFGTSVITQPEGKDTVYFSLNKFHRVYVS